MLSLMQLPPSLIGAAWPPERVWIGLRVCKRTRDRTNSLLEHAPGVVITVKSAFATWAARRQFNDMLQHRMSRLNFRVTLAWTGPCATELVYSAPAMRCCTLVDLTLLPENEVCCFVATNGIAPLFCSGNLRRLRLEGGSFTGEACAILVERLARVYCDDKVPTLEVLELIRMPFTHTHTRKLFASLAFCVNLRALHVVFQEFSAYELGGLIAALPRLETLTMDNTLLGVDMVDFMNGLLAYNNNSDNDNGNDNGNGNGNGNDAVGARPVFVLSSLTSLSLTESELGYDTQGPEHESANIDSFVRFLTFLPSLKHLSLAENDLPVRCLQAVGDQIAASMTGLTSLDLHLACGCVVPNEHISAAGMRWLEHCVNLKHLYISCLNIDLGELSVIVSRLAACTGLASLNISRNGRDFEPHDTRRNDGYSTTFAALDLVTSIGKLPPSLTHLSLSGMTLSVLPPGSIRRYPGTNYDDIPAVADMIKRQLPGLRQLVQ